MPLNNPTPQAVSEKSNIIMKNIWNTALSVAAAVMGAAALVISLCRIEPVTTEWLGILVGTLALITSVLLGWQLFSIINLRTMESKLKSLEEASRKGDSASIGKAYDGIATLYITSLPDSSKTQQEVISSHLYGYLLFTALAMAMQSEAGNFEYCESTIGHLLKMDITNLELNEGQRNNIFGIAVRISSQNKISNFPEYIKWVAALR